MALIAHDNRTPTRLVKDPDETKRAPDKWIAFAIGVVLTVAFILVTVINIWSWKAASDVYAPNPMP
jgi:hypothetical protein